MTNEEVMLRLVCSLNASDSGYIQDRVKHAMMQYNELIQRGVIKEAEHNNDKCCLHFNGFADTRKTLFGEDE